MIVNLIGNAIDALPGGGRILIRTTGSRNWKTDQVGIRITVADDGTGMDRETQSHIFEPFFSTKGITGAGLGLWVSHEIVDKHQGLLQVRSRLATMEQRGGTVFTLFIPAEMDSSLIIDN